jgi:hypothetical protein
VFWTISHITQHTMPTWQEGFLVVIPLSTQHTIPSSLFPGTLLSWLSFRLAAPSSLTE